jgi:hypothetical protein
MTRYGERLMKFCSAFKGAEEEINARIVRLETGWLKTSMQLQFMKQIEDVMDTYHRSVNEKTTEILQSNLKVVISKLER